MNNYLLESEDFVSLQHKIDELIKNNSFSDATISTYDMEENTLENALEDLDTYSFFSDKKVIVIKKIEVLNQEENKKDIAHLMKYLDNSSSDNLLIICAEKLNNVLKITKDLKKKCNYIKIEFDIDKYLKDELKGYKLENGVSTMLLDYCLGDVTKLHNECSKLKNFCIDTKSISKSDVEELVMEKLGDSKDLTFSFTRCLAEKNKNEALKKYKELLSYNIEPLSILGLLASQIRIMYQVKVLEKQNLSNREIANILEEKSDYRISKTRELTRFYSENELLRLMQKLQEIDLQCKSTDVDPNFLIELFIINI